MVANFTYFIYIYIYIYIYIERERERVREGWYVCSESTKTKAIFIKIEMKIVNVFFTMSKMLIFFKLYERERKREMISVFRKYQDWNYVYQDRNEDSKRFFFYNEWNVNFLQTLWEREREREKESKREMITVFRKYQDWNYIYQDRNEDSKRFFLQWVKC